MIERLVTSTAPDPQPLRVRRASRLCDVAAYAAAPLWALQSVIWVAAPKVQEQTPPFRVTNTVMFVLVWSSIAGAVALSAAAAARIPHKVNAARSRAARSATVLGVSSLTMATIATVCTLLAPLPATQAMAISAMSNMLNGAAVLLAASLSLSVFICSRQQSVPSTTTARATSLAAGIIAIIVAIVASGTHSVVGLYFAVCVAALNGIAWFAWARHPSTGRGHQDPA